MCYEVGEERYVEIQTGGMSNDEISSREEMGSAVRRGWGLRWMRGYRFPFFSSSKAKLAALAVRAI